MRALSSRNGFLFCCFHVVISLIIVSFAVVPFSFLSVPVIFLSITCSRSILSALLFVGSTSGWIMQVNQCLKPFSIFVRAVLSSLYGLAASSHFRSSFSHFSLSLSRM